MEPFFSWYDPNTLYSNLFQDIYWSAQGGLLEKEYVFFEGNHLNSRWQKHKSVFIFEFGFGAGLNFFLLWKKLKEQSPDSRIQYFSIEKYPLPCETIEDILKKEKDFEPFLNEFLVFYKNISTGYNQFTALHNNLDLILIVGDVADVIQHFHAKIDVWYLDGFSPAKNPEMWSKEIFYFMKRNSKPGASFATYTTAGIVKESLQEVGFRIEKITGFGNKKFMLRGTLPISRQKIADKPWFKIPKPTFTSKEVVIIGAGIAGTSLAFTLSQKGYSITLIEKEKRITPPPENLAGMFAPLITGDRSDLSDWSFIAYKEFLQFLDLHAKDFPGLFGNIGVFQTTQSAKEVTRIHKALNNSKLNNDDVIFLEDTNSVFQKQTGIFFPKAGWINPFILAQAYLKLAGTNLKRIYQSTVIQLENKNSFWKILLSDNQSLESEIVILANSYNARDLFPCFETIKKVRGQITYYPSEQFPIQVDHVILHEDGYMIPNKNGMHIIGSTFNPKDYSPEVNLEHTIQLLRKLQKIVPCINPSEGMNFLGSVGFRAMSPDHLPLIGPVPDLQEFQKAYSDLWKSNIYKDYPEGKYLHGIYASVGHGSKGILNTFLAANVLASMISGENQFLSDVLLQKMNPSRYTIQSFLKNK